MFRVLLSLTALALLLVPISADEPKKEKPTVELSGDVNDEALQKQAPANGVIVSQEGWEKLAKAWGIKDVPKVDFTKEILVLGTTVGSKLSITTKLDDQGNLKVIGISTADLRPGFRYVIRSVSREGVKTVNGKELPKE